MALATAWALLLLDPGSLRNWVLGIVALPIVFTLVYEVASHLYVATVGLIAASVLSRFFLEIANLKARPEHVMAGLLCLALPWVWNRRENRFEWTRADKLLIGYMIVNLISSWFMSPSPGQNINWALQQLLAILPYFFLRFIVRREDSFRSVFRFFMVVIALEAAYGILAVYSNLLLGTDFGLSLEQYDEMAALYGTMYEPNFLGAYCAAGAVMMLAMYVKRPNRWYMAGYMVTFATMAASFSRAALVACILVLLLLLFVGLKRQLINFKMLARIALATALVIAALSPILWRSYQQRFSTVEVGDVTADPNTLTRTVQLAMGIDQWLDHPLLGNGTASFQLLFDWGRLGTDWEALGWLGNTEIRILHDTGLIGFCLFAGFLIYLIDAARGLLRRQSIPELSALLWGCAVYLLTFQTTEGTLLAFAWVHIGLIACAVAAYSNRQQLPDVPPLPQRN
jgi:O-Antigen ligase